MRWGVLLILAVQLGLTTSQTLRYVDELVVVSPGFANIYVNDENAPDPTERYSLLVSTFVANPTVKDSSYGYEFIGKYLDNFSETPATTLSDQLQFPRDIRQTPVDVFGYPTVTQPDGFLLPGKTNGSVTVFDVSDWYQPVAHDIGHWTQDMWFYHRVHWFDMNGDGRKDAFTCRADIPVIGQPSYEMLFLEQPAVDPLTSGAWPEHVLLSDVCDVFSDVTTLTVDQQTYTVIYTAGYFTNKLAVHWTDDPSGRWDTGMVQTQIIDTIPRDVDGNGPQFFDVNIADLNQDGRLDLLVPWNDHHDGSLYAYQIPLDFRVSAGYVKHKLAGGFDCLCEGDGSGTPGSASTFYPSSQTSGKPWILLSGDDEGTAYYLVAQTQDAPHWGYNIFKFIDQGAGTAIIGSTVAQDVDGDGWTEVFASGWTANRLYVYKFGP